MILALIALVSAQEGAPQAIDLLRATDSVMASDSLTRAETGSRDSLPPPQMVKDSRTIVVKGRRRAAASTGQSQRSLEGSELVTRRGGSLGESLQDVPGVTLLRTGSVVKPVVGGLHSQRLAVIQDGVRIEGQSWGAEHAPETDPFQAERLTVVLGGASVRYGAGAMGGAIVAMPAPFPRRAGWNGEALVTAASNGPVLGTAARVAGMLESLPGLAVRAQGSFRHGGDRSSPVTVLPNTALEEAGAMAGLGWNRDAWGVEISHSIFHSRQGLLATSHIGNLTDLRTALERGEPPDSSSWEWDVGRPSQQVDHGLTRLHLRAGLPLGVSAELTAGWQTDRRQEWDMHRPIDAGLAALDAPSLDYELRTSSGDLLFAAGQEERLRVQWGGSGLFQENEYSGRAFVPNYRAQGAGAFLMASRGNARWGADAGLRWDVHSLDVWRRKNGEILHWDGNWSALSASAGARVNPWQDAWTFRSALSTGWRPPAAVELWADGLHHGATSIEKGDSSLGAERSLTAQVGADGRIGPVTLQASLWWTRVDGYIGLVPVQPAVLTVRGAFPAFRYRATTADLRGLDAGLVWHVAPWIEPELRGGWMRTRDANGDPLPFSPPTRAVLRLWGIPQGSWAKGRVRLAPRLDWQARSEAFPGDYAAPPAQVFLWGLELVAEPGGAGEDWTIAVTGQNLSDVTWRDPTDRLRYFASAPGRSVDLKVARRL